MLIPFCKPLVMPNTSEHVQNALSGQKFSGDGPYSELVTSRLVEYLACKQVLLTPSCTAALELCALLIDCNQSCEIIMPSYTFSSTANAFALRGAKIVFADVEPSTFNIDLNHVQSLINQKTAALVVVNYAGMSCDLIKARKICDDAGIVLIEDAAQSLGSKFSSKNMGTFGHLAALSFHETKNIHCGEGGALIINHERFLERAEILREKGTNRRSFQRGEVAKYKWVDIGSSYLLNEVSAAMLFSQIEAIDEITSARRDIWFKYAQALGDKTGMAGIQTVQPSPDIFHNGHLYSLIFSSSSNLLQVQNDLLNRGMLAVTHYEPLHSSPFFKRENFCKNSLKVTEHVSDKLLRLPMWVGMHEEQRDVIDTVLESLEKL